MPKQILNATVRVPDEPRVRFFKRKNDPALTGKDGLEDVTSHVVRLVVEDLESPAGQCNMLRLNAAGELVWKTRHQSMRELKWYAEFEYGLPAEKWIACEA